MRYPIAAIALGVPLATSQAKAQTYANGMAQPVFAGQPAVRHNVWVEVPSLDTDRDGVNDRIRVRISRPDVTDRGTRLPVILVASPYSGGTMPYPRYDITVPLFLPGVTPAAAPLGPLPPISTQK
jgi:X-Pro dipeptidyl-peptidase